MADPRSPMHDWIAQLFRDENMLRMGDGPGVEDRNLGFGWVYYALARLLRPERIVVIGSYRGFAPLVFGKALHDNGQGGSVWFIHPSLGGAFWRHPDATPAHLAEFGVTNIRHFLMTTQNFVDTGEYRALGRVDLVLIDGL